MFVSASATTKKAIASTTEGNRPTDNEWSYAGGEPPTFHIVLGVPAEAQRQDVVPDVSFALPPRAVLRWPEARA